MKQRTVDIYPTGREAQIIQRLLSSGTEDSSSNITLTFARIVWNRITEPGDRVAQMLIQTCGEENALRYLIAGTPAGMWLEVISEHDDAPSLTHTMLDKAIARWTPRLDRTATSEDLALADSLNMSIVQPGDAHWPEQLGDLGTHAPHLLWARGDTSLLGTQALAVVGARASTRYGEEVTHEMTALACKWERTIVSGVAYGIDAVAHRTALSLDSPTIAVLAGGADRIYPTGHAALIEAMIKQGLVISELPPGSAPTRWRFLLRNRIIATISQATLVTEAGLRSGSINTAGHAAQLGRALGAVPGPITSAGSHGCFHLIKEYAASMIATEYDLEELLGINMSHDVVSTDRESSLYRRIIDAVPLRGMRSTRDIAKHAGVGEREAELALVELELLNRVKQHAELQGQVKWSFIKR